MYQTPISRSTFRIRLTPEEPIQSCVIIGSSLQRSSLGFHGRQKVGDIMFRITGDCFAADVIFVMERHHRDKIRKRFRSVLGQRPVYVLGIPDEYERDQPELIAA